MARNRKEKYDLISVSHYFPPRVGGLENMAYHLLKGLSQKGIRCLAVYGGNKNCFKKEKNFDRQSFKTISIFNNTYPLFGLRFLLSITKAITQNPNAKIVIHSRHLTSSIITSIVCRILKHPYTLIEHNGGPVYFSSKTITKIANWVDKNIFNSVIEGAEDILAVSQTSKEWISKNFGISKKRIGIIYNSFNTRFNIEDIDKKENLVVFASKWIRVKDPCTTLKAYFKLAKRFPDWRFLIIGEGKELEIKDLVLPKNIEIINKLLGQRELFKMLRKSKIYINSSLSEGLALGILEAVSLGNIPVLSDAKSNREVAEKLNTREFTFRRRSPNSLAMAIEKAIYRSKNKKIFSNLIAKNEEHYSKKIMVETYYQRLLPKHYLSKNMNTLSIIIPAYNEENTVVELLEKVSSVKLPRRVKKEIIIVNDKSKDNTRELVKQYINKNRKLNKYILLDNYRNKGKSQSVKKGISVSTGDLVVTQDADLEYNPNDLVLFVKEFQDNPNIDVIYGNRFNKGNHFSNGIHSLGNRFVTFMSNTLTRPKGFSPKDMETCYKMVRGDIMRSLFRSLESTSNFGLEPEITAKLARYRKPSGKRLIFKEIDIYYSPRTVSQGKKMRWFKHGFEALLEILYFNLSPFVVEEYINKRKVKRQF
jgi:glycosyltransferase involved in cell wall biosynthesis